MHSVARYQGTPNFGDNIPFSQRRGLAEHLLTLGVVNVNEVKFIPTITELHQPPGWGEDATPLSHASAAQDWEFAEWLLEHGADPDALGGKAFQPQWWYRPHLGPSEPKEVLTDLVERVREKAQRGVSTNL